MSTVRKSSKTTIEKLDKQRKRKRQIEKTSPKEKLKVHKKRVKVNENTSLVYKMFIEHPDKI